MDVPVADYRNSGKPITANSNVKQTAKVLQFPKRNVSRKANVQRKAAEVVTLKIAA